MCWLLCGAAMLLGGCQVVTARLESAAYFSITSAGYAGRFRLAYGRWPANTDELEEFTCMRGRADKFGMQTITCDEIVRTPYRTVLEPDGRDLRIRYYDRANALACTLELRAPPPGAEHSIFPSILIESNLFACSGRPWQRGTAELG
jgi:hypothetical protein